MEHQVIISGAGPVGCWLACELQLAGVQTLLIEQTATISPQSRALTIHPRTIEVFAMRGAHHEMLAQAVRIPSGHFAVFEHRLDFKQLDTRFDYTLAIPQARITAILQERARSLGADIRRSEKVCRFEQNPEGVSVWIENSQLEQYVATAQWLVGCDGTRSTVRQQAGIAFPGTDATVLGWLGDAMLTDPPEGVMIGEWGLNGTAMVAKLPDGQHRLVGLSPDDVNRSWPGDLPLEELREKVRAVFGTDFGLHSPSWLSRYSNTSRQAESYRKNRVFLAGDAAHQHMPAGGVGLNIGIQDAMNLGWKLAAVINGWMPHSLLDSYHQERYPVGQDLLEHTQAQTALMSCFSVEGMELRAFLNKLIKQSPALEKTLAERLSGLSVLYPSTVPGDHALVGRRAADQDLVGGQSLFGLLEQGHYVMLEVSGHDNDELECPEGLKAVLYRSSLAVRSEGWEHVTAVLIRPDGYIAWASNEQDATRLRLAMRHALTPFQTASHALETTERLADE